MKRLLIPLLLAALLAPSAAYANAFLQTHGAVKRQEAGAKVSAPVSGMRETVLDVDRDSKPSNISAGISLAPSSACSLPCESASFVGVGHRILYEPVLPTARRDREDLLLAVEHRAHLLHPVLTYMTNSRRSSGFRGGTYPLLC